VEQFNRDKSYSGEELTEKYKGHVKKRHIPDQQKEGLGVSPSRKPDEFYFER
jgi:hypothetical protein